MTSAHPALSYSLCSVLAYACGGFIFYLQAKKKKIISEKFFYVILSALLGGLIGSRLGSALFVYRSFYAQYPWMIFSPAAGGKTVVGGIIGGYAAVLIAKRIFKVHYASGDCFAPALALGIAIGRIGCFLNGCCYGTVSNVPWSIRINNQQVHPTQLYESLFCFLLFLFLWIIRNRTRKDGDLFKIFLLIYSFFRFWIEFLRGDKVIFIFNVSIAQVLSASVFLLVSFYFLRPKKTA